ncbi:MAG: nucleotidyl transferase AbiEii/AbiGii toxin family protein [Thermodesulfobacteriota bacterium]|nr:nucleotidyl transferase AbiEii/AbiGii toxin family protein [Thermodesulfobacteriota bacterium]
MDTLRDHEVFEIDVLEKMNSAKMLEPLVFGGGTMLRLCHELNRYSVDLDFWFVKTISEGDFFKKVQKILERDYEITDAQVKHYTILFELRSSQYRRRLKIEIRRKWKECDYQQTIAFSRFSTKQVLLKAHTLQQTMENKIQAFLDRGEIRDAFDIEFLLRRGVEIPFREKGQFIAFQKKLARLRDRDFKVKLGSILEDDIRKYYLTHKFGFLQERLASMVF